MSAVQTEDLKRQIELARKRDDRVEVARLRFQLPLSERSEVVTAAGRGYRTSPARVGYDGGSTAPAPVISMSGYLLDEVRGLEWDGREEGAWLACRQTDGAAIDIVRMIGRTDPDLSTRTSCVLDFNQARQLERELPEDQFIGGNLHFQPDRTDPSESDLNHWRFALNELGRDQFVGLIVRALDPFAFAAFVTRREADRIVHRSAEIKTWRH